MKFRLRVIPFYLTLLALVASLLGGALTVTPARAASIVVNSNADTVADDGQCTLREAITNANNDSQLFASEKECDGGFGEDTITFASNYTITLDGSQLPAITTKITINGAANTIIIQANAAADTATYRVLEVETTGNLTLDSVTIQNGDCSSGSCATFTSRGGGMLNRGTATLTNVNFSSNSALARGGGMYNSGNTTLTNVTFSGNSAENGGGMHNDINSSATLTNVIFSGNSAEGGGGMRNDSNNPTLTNVTFNDNSADYGGGMLNQGNVTLTGVTFSSNSATDGGGMYNWNSSNPTLTNVTFSNNSAGDYGGGMYNLNSSNPTLTNVTFSNNSATIYGGGMYNWNSSNPMLTNVTFSKNLAGWGGGVVNGNSNPTLTNVTLSSNSATNAGGGMYNYDNSDPTITNATFSGNSADYGSGIYNYDNSSSPLLINVIVAGSSIANNCENNDSSSFHPSSSHNLIDDSSCGLTDGVNGNKIGASYNAMLGPLADNGGFTQTHALLAASPAINAGTNVDCPLSDQRGITRTQGTTCDIGAFEFVFPIYTSQGTNDGWVLESSETSGQGGTLNKGAKTINIGDDALNRQYRAILSFNTASLPDNAAITKVTLKVKRQSVTGGGNPITTFGGFMVDIKKGNFGKAGLQLADFSTKGNKTYGAFKPKAASGGWYSINLTTGKNHINKFGNTQIRLRFKTDDNNNFTANFLRIHSGNAGTSSRPQLIVEYSNP